MTATSRRTLAAVAAGALLVLLVVVPPGVLVVWGQWPTGGDGAGAAEGAGVFGTGFAAGGLTVAGWVIWALFVGTVAVEGAAAAGRGTRVRVPAPATIRLIARLLVAATAAGLSLRGPASHQAGPVPDLATALVQAGVPPRRRETGGSSVPAPLPWTTARRLPG